MSVPAMKFSQQQWKLIYDSVRKQQINSIVDGSTYKEYDIILNELWEVVFNADVNL